MNYNNNLAYAVLTVNQINIRMRLFELFSPGKVPAGVEWRREPKQHKLMTDYSIVVDTDDAPLIYSINIVNLYAIPGLYEISFVLHTDDNDITSDHVGLNIKKEFAVFSGVIACLRDFVKITPDIRGLYFSSKGNSRTKLYARLANKLADELGWTTDKEVAGLIEKMQSGWGQFIVIDPSEKESLSNDIIDFR